MVKLTLVVCLGVLISGCQTFNVCRDNPRNMSCMSEQELEKALTE